LAIAKQIIAPLRGGKPTKKRPTSSSRFKFPKEADNRTMNGNCMQND
jgi:hypothetical protein